MEFDSVYNMDCLQGMQDIPDAAIDMILCDLPYGTTRNKWDICLPLDELWRQYRRVIKDNGAIVLFGDGMFTATLMKSNPTMWRYNLVWDKLKGTDFLNANVKPLKCHEDVMVFYKRKPVFNKQLLPGKPYVRNRGGEKTKSTNWGDHGQTPTVNDGGRCPLTVLRFKADNPRIHPTQKPVPLLEWLIRTYTNPGEVVLDSCMGVGSTCVAAVKTGRRYIGYELDKRYYDIACERIARAKANVQKAVIA